MRLAAYDGELSRAFELFSQRRIALLSRYICPAQSEAGVPLPGCRLEEFFPVVGRFRILFLIAIGVSNGKEEGRGQKKEWRRLAPLPTILLPERLPILPIGGRLTRTRPCAGYLWWRLLCCE